MRARGLKSPDRADAVVGVFGIGSGFANSTNRRFALAPSSDPMAALTEHYEGHPRVDDYERAEATGVGQGCPIRGTKASQGSPGVPPWTASHQQDAISGVFYYLEEGMETAGEATS